MTPIYLFKKCLLNIMSVLLAFKIIQVLATFWKSKEMSVGF